MLKHYIEFYYPGVFFAENSVKNIKDRSANVKIPDNCFAYRYFDVEETVVEGEKLKGKPKNYSGMYYFGKVYSLQEVKQNFSEHDTLIRNMESNEWHQVIKTRCGNWQPFTKKDKIVDEE